MESRQDSFNQGLGQHPTMPASLQADSARQNAFNPRAFVANGLNMPIMHSPNGMSAADATRQTPQGQLPSMNGSSASTYSQINPHYGIGLQI